MRAIFETRGSQQVDVHYMNTGIPAVVEENFGGYYLADLTLEEVLDQESVYQSLQTNSGNNRAKASASTDPNLEHDQSGGERRVPRKEGESSVARSFESQLALDEALARDLQEAENHRGDVSLSEITGTAGAANREVSSASTETSARTSVPVTQLPSTLELKIQYAEMQAVSQDNIDPDNMTYEELQFLGEAIGTESRGLSEELISYLPSSKYKTGFFSRKDKHEECVICCTEYKNRDVLITLPCLHQYHSKCVTRWLKLNKVLNTLFGEF
ncbi:hypothetical protein HHK36_000281 [Tetracentron sinense]|uniref:RING-type domain-containing protein n=1 Tax=Tetracentron sinense TaxID=13715 RepID=A0A834ZV81_TETSI|nr:hypothetical protein HHK36_000281 [Tetracentron sinense]